ncbi:MAG: prolyl oligopeptidase family serine peptidase [Pseudomonadota bacterium]
MALLWVSLTAHAEPANGGPAEPARFVSLAPGGQFLVSARRVRDGDGVVVALVGDPTAARRILWQTSGRITNLTWIDAGHLLVAVREPRRARWYRVSWPSGGQRLLLSEGLARREGPRLVGRTAQNDLLVASDRRRPYAPDLYRVGETGVRELLERNPGHVFRWHPDARGAVRLARGWRADPAGGVRYTWLWRASAQAGWQPIRSRQLRDDAWRALGPAVDEATQGQYFYVFDEGTARVLRIDLATGQVAPASAAPPSLESVVFGAAGRPALYLVGGNEPGTYPVPGAAATPGLKQLQALPGDRRRLQPLAPAHWLAGPDTQGQHLLTLTHDGVRTRPLVAADLAPVATAELASRDGKPIDVIVTGPANPRGLVLWVHGGPWAADTAGWHPEAQWLAGRGFQVLQVNFRGSTNRGAAWMWAGRRGWDGPMLDDLEDALRWARVQPAAAGKPVCAMGNSFGGYAALMLAARRTLKLDCAVARAPVTDLKQQLTSLRDRGNARGLAEWTEMVGNPADPDFARSPIELADRIGVPVLLAHGGQDTIVDPDQSHRLRAALAAAGNAPRWLALADEGHNLWGASQRRRYYAALAEFLDRTLGDNG